MAFPRNAAVAFVLVVLSMIGLASAQTAKFHTCRIKHILAVPIPVDSNPSFVPHVGVRCKNGADVGGDTVTDFVIPTDAEVFKLLIAANQLEPKRDVILHYFTDRAMTAGMCGSPRCRKFRNIIML